VQRRLERVVGPVRPGGWISVSPPSSTKDGVVSVQRTQWTSEQLQLQEGRANFSSARRNSRPRRSWLHPGVDLASLRLCVSTLDPGSRARTGFPGRHIRRSCTTLTSTTTTTMADAADCRLTLGRGWRLLCFFTRGCPEQVRRAILRSRGDS